MVSLGCCITFPVIVRSYSQIDAIPGEENVCTSVRSVVCDEPSSRFRELEGVATPRSSGIARSW